MNHHEAEMMNDYSEQLIKAIYDGPLEASPWQSFLGRFRQIMRSNDVGLFVHLPELQDYPLRLRSSEQVGHFVSRYNEKYIRDDPWLNYRMRPGELATLDQVVDMDQLRQSAFYREFMLSHGAVYGLKMALDEPDGSSASLLVGRVAAAGNFVASDKALCRVLLPHLQKSLRIYHRLAAAEIERGLYQRLLDRQQIGVLLLDSEGRLLTRNDIAECFIDGKLMSVSDGRLVIRDRATNDELRCLIDRACRMPPPPGEEVVVGAIGFSTRGRPEVSLLVKAVSSATQFGINRPHVMICLCNGRAAPTLSRQLVADLFQLTDAQAAVAIELSRGLSLRETAAKLGVSEHTVRTQSKQIYAITGCRGQMDLVRTILSSVASLS